MPEAGTVSGSMAGHCRTAIWIRSHLKGVEEPLVHSVQRMFDFGDSVEVLMFDGLTAGGKEIKPWWPQVDSLVDPATGETFSPKMSPYEGRQREVEVDGFLGHIDALTYVDGAYPAVVDCKTMRKTSFKKNSFDDLMGNVFSREYVMQLHFYMEGLRRQGLDVKRSMIVGFDKDSAALMCRFIEYQPELIEEVKERLSWARSGSEPVPEWAWEKGRKIPLRCSYCIVKGACGELRGMGLDMMFEGKQPVWYAT